MGCCGIICFCTREVEFMPINRSIKREIEIFKMCELRTVLLLLLLRKIYAHAFVCMLQT